MFWCMLAVVCTVCVNTFCREFSAVNDSLVGNIDSSTYILERVYGKYK